MNFLDWLIVVLYVIGLIALSVYLSKKQATTEDYYLGGRTLSWWTVGLSTMATQLSAISFISAPAFVALKPNGGLIWLGYEFAVPLAMIFLMIFIVPVLYRAGVVSIYEYLERRFDSTTRSLISLIFQISRALASGVSFYALGIVLSAVLDIPLAPTIVFVGFISILYETLGGIKADIYSDVIQMLVLTLGIIICGWVAYGLAGGWESIVSTISPERLQIMNISSHGFGDGNDFSFWALLFGGFFLYASYYGCDQSQAQRQLSAKSVDESKKSLLFNGFGRFPVVVAYCAMGIFIGAFAIQNGEFMGLIPEGKVDYMVPVFILNYLPHGVIGFIIVAILAAFMSSIDSAINSLSAATMKDIYQRYVRPNADESHYFLWSKIFTVFWGVICTAFAFLVGSISETVIEAINKVGSVFYGPILAVFILAVLTETATAGGAKAGVVSGILVNLLLWFGFPDVSWLWWNATGCVSALVVGYMYSLLSVPIRYTTSSQIKKEPGEINWNPRYVLLIIYFLGIMFLSYIVGAMWI
jgi:SSS family transporter